MGVLVPGRRQLAGAAAQRPAAGADAGGLWRPAGRHPPTARFLAQPGGKPNCLGRAAGGSVSARGAGREAATDRHRRLPRAGGGDCDGVSPGAASALLGAQDAEPSGTRAETRLRRGQARRAGNLSGRQPTPGPGCLSPLSPPLAGRLPSPGATTGARSARTAVILQLPPALVAEAAHHQRHRALLCRGPAAYPAHGVLCERKQRGPNHLLHLPALQPGMEKPHPQGFYTSRVTSPWQLPCFTPFAEQNYNHHTATRDSLRRAALQRLASQRFPRGSGRRGFQGVRDQPMKRILLRSLLPVAVLAVSALAQTANSAASAPAGASGGGSPAAPAAGAVSNRIGVIDIQSAILATNEGRREFEALQKKFEPKQNELTKLNQEIDELKKQLQAQGDKLNEEARGTM